MCLCIYQPVLQVNVCMSVWKEVAEVRGVLFTIPLRPIKIGLYLIENLTSFGMLCINYHPKFSFIYMLYSSYFCII